MEPMGIAPTPILCPLILVFSKLRDDALEAINVMNTEQSVCRVPTLRPLSSSFLRLPYRILDVNHKKEPIRGPWVNPKVPPKNIIIIVITVVVIIISIIVIIIIIMICFL